MYIYIDILIITNIYVNFFLLKATARVSHSPLKNGRCILSAVIGSLFSLIILLPEMDNLILLLVRMSSAALIVFLAFKCKSFKDYYRKSLVFLFICFIFAGIEYGLTILFKSGTVYWNNTMLYIDISLTMLVISTVVSYLIISVFRYFLDNKNDFDGDYVITVTNNDKTIEFKAISDTCNNLTDSFSGKPIIVCSKKSLLPLIDETELDSIMNFLSAPENDVLYKGWRLIPFSTINSNGLLPSFLPSSIYIKNNETKSIKYTAAYIGIVDKDMDYAIFNPKILMA